MSEWDLVNTYSCTISAFTNLFRINNIDILAEEIFCILDGFNISYEKMSVGIEMPDLFFKLEEYGIDYTVKNINSITYEELKSYIKKYGYGIAYVKTFYLDYNLFYQAKENINRTHFIIFGSINQNEIEVYDTHYTYDNTYKVISYKGKMSLASFNRAAIDVYFFDFEKFKFDRKSIFDVFKKNMIYFINGNSEGKRVYGIPAIRKYFEDLLETSEYALYHLAIELNYNIKICSVIYIINYIYAIVEKYDNDSDLLDGLENEKKQWNKLAFWVLKAGIEDNKAEFKRLVREECLRRLGGVENMIKRYLEK